MVNRDKAGSFTLEQLKQQYNLDNRKITKMIEQQAGELKKVDNELQNTISSIILNLGELLESQSDISLWFFSGVPTLENQPYVDWETPIEHEGDFYYDRETGNVYKYYNGEWVEQEDGNLTTAMALTNVETDIDDNERKIFLQTPTPSYVAGDWYIKEDGTLYICQIGKQAGNYEEQDFIIFNKYQNAIATKDSNKLILVEGKVTKIEEIDLREIRQEMEENKYYEDEEGNQALISQSVSEVVQTLNGVETKISTTGGNNLIKNSALFFKDTNGYYDYWIGSLERGRADESNVMSESGTVILTKVAGANQIVNVVPGTYTLSFKYRQKISLSTLTIFGDTITDDSGIKKYLIETTTGVIDISFLSSVDDGYCIYDLMLNKGEIALQYSQNANETATDTVKIGKGISVESSSTETITRVDSDGFRVLNKSETEVLLRATDTGTESKTLTVKSWSEISGLRFQETNGQTWITGII